MEEKYNNIIKEAQVLFDSILKDSLLVQDVVLNGELQITSSTKRDIKICLTDNT